MRRMMLCLAALVFAGGAVHAATMSNIPMNAWRVVDGASNVGRDFLLLCDESALHAAVNMEIGALVMTARTTADRRQGVLTNLTLTYDDGAEETVSVRVPADTQQHEVTFAPQYSAWRRVTGLKLMHPADDMELLVTRLTAVAELPAMSPPPAGMTPAGLLTGEKAPNGLFKVKWMAGAGNPVQLTAPRSRMIIAFAAKVANSEWGLRSEEDLVLVAKGANGRELKRVSAKVDGRVQPVLFYLGDVDMTQVERLVFEASGNTDFVIRGMTAWDAATGGASSAELKQINDRLDLFITFIEQGGQLQQQMLWQLKQLLIDYRRLE